MRHSHTAVQVPAGAKREQMAAAAAAATLDCCACGLCQSTRVARGCLARVTPRSDGYKQIGAKQRAPPAATTCPEQTANKSTATNRANQVSAAALAAPKAQKVDEINNHDKQPKQSIAAKPEREPSESPSKSPSESARWQLCHASAAPLAGPRSCKTPPTWVEARLALPGHRSRDCGKLARLAASRQLPPLPPPPPMLHNHTNGTKERTEADQRQRRDKDVDSGYAWVILATVFAINASTFGTARAYGLIFDKLAREHDQGRAQAALPFTLMGAIENMAGPLSGYLLARLGSWRATVCLGSCLITLAHCLASLASGAGGGGGQLLGQWAQLLAMGPMCGLGLSLVTISFFQINNAYFVRYRSTAFGVGLTGAAFGTLYISPMCQYFLDNYNSTSACYLMLSLVLFPNVPLSLLLKPKEEAPCLGEARGGGGGGGVEAAPAAAPAGHAHNNHLATISKKLADEGAAKPEAQAQADSVWLNIARVLRNPIFHLIWPTQLMFCWFNFVFGMIIVDFGKDRGLSNEQVAQLVPVWAFGQLVGRTLLGSLVDLKYITYRTFTILCFAAIGATTLALNSTRWPLGGGGGSGGHLVMVVVSSTVGLITTTSSNVAGGGPASSSGSSNVAETDDGQHGGFLLLAGLVLLLSAFIALLYILFNGLVVNYVEPRLQPLSIGISSFTGSFFLLPRAAVIGHYRDTIGNYDAMLTVFAWASLLAALLWLLVPPVSCRLRQWWLDQALAKLELCYSGRGGGHLDPWRQPISVWILSSSSSSGKENAIQPNAKRKELCCT